MDSCSYRRHRDRVKEELTEDEFHAWEFLFRPQLLLTDEEGEAVLKIVRKSVNALKEGLVLKGNANNSEEGLKNNRSTIRVKSDESQSENHGIETEDQENDVCMEDFTGREDSKLEELLPRSYQLQYFELIKERNIIVHLDTGLGKTLIAILAASYFLENPTDSPARQVLVLVPTISLTEQHFRSFKTNTLTSSYSLKSISGNVKTSQNNLADKAGADILITTYGVGS